MSLTKPKEEVPVGNSVPEGLFDIPKPSVERPVDASFSNEAPEEHEPIAKAPTLSAYREMLQKKPDGTPKNAFSEAFSSYLDKSMDKEELLMSRLANLKNRSPEDRANIGSKFGGMYGVALGGETGALIGAGIGSMIGRSLGAIQSGEHEANTRRQKMLETFKLTKLTNDDGVIKFEDGSSSRISLEPDAKLRNLNSALSGKKDRPMYEIDPSHPMSKRTTAVARPIAYIFAQGMMNWRDPKNEHDAKALEHTTGMLVNTLQDGATDINQVYARAREIAEKKLKMKPEQVRKYFDSIKYKIDEDEFESITFGLDKIYGS